MSDNRFYYGWTLVFALAFTETTSWGVLFYSFTVFLNPMQADLGRSRVEITAAFSLALLVSAVAAIPAGHWLDRHGPRLLMTSGSCAAALLVVAWAAVHTLVELYAVWFLIGVVMAAVLYEPAFAVVATWFRRQRAAALTVLTLVAGLASVIYLPLSGMLVASIGWRAALAVLAVILAAATIPPHALLLRRSPEEKGLRPDATTAVKRAESNDVDHGVSASAAVHGRTFWLLATAFLFGSLAIGIVFVHIVPLLVDRGMSPAAAARTAGLIGLAALPGRLVFTPLGNRVPRGTIVGGIFLMQGLAMFALLVLNGTAGVVVFVVLFGMGFGAVTPARAALVADYYGAASFGAISGTLAFFVTTSRGVAPVAAAVLYDLGGSYRPVLLCLLAASLLASAFVVLAERSVAVPAVRLRAPPARGP